MDNLRKEFDKRLNKIILMVEATTRKIIKKEIKKIKREIVKGWKPLK